MEFNIIATGSSGNLYTLSDGVTSIMIEAGLNISAIKKQLKFRLTSHKVCILTHEHIDHVRGAKDVSKYIPIAGTEGTLNAIMSSNKITMTYNVPVFFDTLKVTPFETIHNAAMPCGYLIKSINTGKQLVFVTDSQVISYKFSGINYLVCECNYDRDILEANVDKGLIDRSQYDKIVSNHLALDTVLEIIKGYDSLEKVYLIHLSERNLNRKKMIAKIREIYEGKLYDKEGEIK